MARYLFLAFTVVPFVELYLLIGIGRQVGVLPTLGMVVASGLLGAWLAKREGRRVLRSWQGAVAQGRLPEEGILHGALVLVGGVLLITPGVLTDAVGFLLLLPPARRFIAARLRRALDRRMQAGTLRVGSFGWGGFPGMGSSGEPFSRASPPSRRSQGEVDAEFTDEGPGR
ncbi:FxsA family protein [Hyalangium rubrum]|uniref:FxsA family protein n=1 Tax=Hyalangium rubrum TaxID=3103134 RepID=A0ABU5H9E0_9BACT|nr:FxsA family protein [Hyalangium sp. s54d21]MDY7228715.1 FxsA family protein [Hyalangium sp. s54d21]